MFQLLKQEENYNHILKSIILRWMNNGDCKAFQDNPKQYIPRLQELIAKMHAANDELVKIFAEMKKEVKMIY